MSAEVLVVDDSLTVRMDLLKAFDAAQIAMFGCATVREAREVLTNRSFAVVILDVILPDGDGIALLREIRARTDRAGTFVIMLSTEAEVRDRLRGLSTGADEYVAKPYDVDAIVARIRTVLRRHEGPERRTSVLVIDDSATVRDTLSRALRERGYDVLTAATGEAGLHVAAATHPDAIIVDGTLPGIDGATVIQRVRLDAALRATPCILLTGSDDREDELRAYDGGADAFVRKEAELDVLLARLAAALLSAAASGRRSGPMPEAPLSKVLVVDDSPTYLHELADVLRADAYDVVLARSGEEALELLALQRVDCILLDVRMPGLDGHATCQEIKRSPTLRDTPLILLTGHESRDSMVQGLVAGADDYIPKSSEWEVLRARVRAQIRRRTIETEARRVLVERELEAREARAARELAETRAALADALARKNQELEAFSYSVSHDLRAPLRRIDGFATILEEDYGPRLDDGGRDYLRRIRRSVVRMDALIGDLMGLARVTREEIRPVLVDVSALCRGLIDDLQRRDPERRVVVEIASDVGVHGDARLLQAVLENLIGNAWKYTARKAEAHIWVERDGTAGFSVRDDGAGFDMTHASRLFQPFSRLHSESDFEGNGIGLATVARIVERHGGSVRAHAKPGEGASFHVQLPRAPSATRTVPHGSRG